ASLHDALRFCRPRGRVLVGVEAEAGQVLEARGEFLMPDQRGLGKVRREPDHIPALREPGPHRLPVGVARAVAELSAVERRARLPRAPTPVPDLEPGWVLDRL